MKTTKRIIDVDYVEPEQLELLPKTTAEPDDEEAARIVLMSLKEKVDKEIREHHIWCGKKCQTFLSSAYREARLSYGMSAEEVQDNYDSCHIFR